MKNLEKLKKEHKELKERLVKLIAFMNDEAYFNLDSTEKGLLTNQRMGMEIYINALSQRIYGVNEIKLDSMLPILLMSMMNPLSTPAPLPPISLSSNDNLNETTKK